MTSREPEILVKLRARGARRFKKLLDSNGGLLTEEGAAGIQCIPLSELARQVEDNAILVIVTESGQAFPAFQFDADHRCVFPEIVTLLRSSPGDSHAAYIRFLLSQFHPPEDRESPMDKVRNGTLGAARLVELYDRRFEPGQ